MKNAASEASLFGFSAGKARRIYEELVDRIETRWKDAVEFAGLTRFQADLLRRATVLPEGCFY